VCLFECICKRERGRKR
jgi:hypothetical protein